MQRSTPQNGCARRKCYTKDFGCCSGCTHAAKCRSAALSSKSDNMIWATSGMLDRRHIDELKTKYALPDPSQMCSDTLGAPPLQHGCVVGSKDPSRSESRTASRRSRSARAACGLLRAQCKSCRPWQCPRGCYRLAVRLSARRARRSLRRWPASVRAGQTCSRQRDVRKACAPSRRESHRLQSAAGLRMWQRPTYTAASRLGINPTLVRSCGSC